MKIYICSKKISNNFLSINVIAEPIIVLGKLTNFLRNSEEIDCTDCNGSVNFKKNMARTQLVIFGNKMKNLFEQILHFSNKEGLILFNALDSEFLSQTERIFYSKSEKLKYHLQSLKGDYEKHKANKDAIKMYECIKNAEDIISGKVKIK